MNNNKRDLANLLEKRMWCSSTSRHLIVLWFCVLLSLLLPCGHCRVFTSSEKLSTLSDTSVEISLLNSLQKYINGEFHNLFKLSQFVQRRKEASPVPLNNTHEGQITKILHPNRAYHLIKHYVHVYHALLINVSNLKDYLDKDLPELPTELDYKGACSSIVLLAEIYDLNLTDVIAGNYSGFLGPPLYVNDVFEIGRVAFHLGLHKQSCEWLSQTSVMLQEKHAWDKLQELGASTFGLLERAHKFLNESEKADAVHEKALFLGITENRMMELMKQEMNDSQLLNDTDQMDKAHIFTIGHLCRRDKLQRVTVQYGYHICRYKADLYTPYVRYKEEILSISPFVSLFYDVITDAEIEEMKSAVRKKMSFGKVGWDSTSFLPLTRTNEVGWLFDNMSVAADRLSKSIKGMTGLQVLGPLNEKGFTDVSVPYQMALYGMGGHYTLHLDAIHVEDEEDDDPNLNDIEANCPDGNVTDTGSNDTDTGSNVTDTGSNVTDTGSNDTDDSVRYPFGNRLATYLIYLSDVEKGGHTVFYPANISVAPQKGMALFWYNWDTRMEFDHSAQHAGCPVLLGTKWIANKWIYAARTNVFRRPCGLYEDWFQKDIEPLMYEAHREIEKNGGWRHAF